VSRYDCFIRSCWESGDKDPAVIAQRLIQEKGCGMPERLFMALYTVTEHIKEF
jgi:hypothetical protein